jgi:hypothetical protein
MRSYHMLLSFSDSKVYPVFLPWITSRGIRNAE